MVEIPEPDDIRRTSGILNRRLLHVVLICLVGLIVYSNTFHVPFQWDEGRFIRDNPVVKDFSFFLHPSQAPAQFYGALVGRYIGFLTFAINHKIGGFNVTGYHVFNLTVHIFNALLVYLLVVLTFKTPYFRKHGAKDMEHRAGNPAVFASWSGNFIALFAALLFVSHPVQIEAVTYIFQRLASLAAMFYLLSIVFYIRGRLSSLFCSLLFAILAMKTKENTFTLPIIIILYEFLFFEGSRKIRAVFLTPISLTLLIIPITLVLTSGVRTNPFDPSSMVFRHIPRWDYFVTQARVIVTYVRLFFLPFNQDIDYDYPVFHSVLDPAVLLPALFVLSLFAIGVCLFLKSRQAGKPESLPADDSGFTFHDSEPSAPYYRLISFGIFWFFITLSVESSLQPLPQVIDEYRMYLPLAGVVLAVAAGLFLLWGKLRGSRKRLAMILLAVAFAISFSAATYARNSVWETKISLWRDAVSKSPGKATVHINLGVAYSVAGELDKAIVQYQWALRLDPFYSQSYIDLCIAYSTKNATDAAIHYCRTAVSLYPGSARAHYGLGRMYLEKGLADDARREAEIALQIKPGLYDARELLYEIEQAESGRSSNY